MLEENPKYSNLFLNILVFGCVLSVIASFYFFYYRKDYDFIVEVPCNITQETCFQRDCRGDNYCPPNGLSNFKRYSLKAGDFQACGNEDCAYACSTGAIKCEPVECQEDLEVGEFCVYQNPSVENQI